MATIPQLFAYLFFVALGVWIGVKLNKYYEHTFKKKEELK